MQRSLSLIQKSTDKDCSKHASINTSEGRTDKHESPRRRNTMESPPVLQRTPTNVSSSSLVGLMASKRLARRLTSKLFSGRSSMMSSSRLSVPVQREPTYRMEPHSRVQIDKVKSIIESVLADNLTGSSYGVHSKTLCILLGEEIKEKVKKLQYDRYKVVTHVLIGELNNQGLEVASRCVWDTALDDYASCNFRNKNLFCTASVYMVYHE
ncbi:hypothetical protein FSP39_006420 [Pinctada imbricata]|uniref:Uncharacterized protein n=1 Tax=Pinctada imbricata TaxID=66713 RepID=A0AA88Y590_PINIB|nr:hypothetical protein FSP39_006420 [Pinctada imbricata]